LTQPSPVAAEPELLAPLAPDRAKTIAPAIPRPMSQPNTKTGPLTFAPMTGEHEHDRYDCHWTECDSDRQWY
jgi:hypothetical protein